MRRLFSTEIVDSDAFLDMPISTQALYFHLGMRADDDGFVNPRKIMRTVGASDDDLKVLLGKRFLLTFNSGVVVVKHWLIHNSIRKDRYHETKYLDEKNTLFIKENKAYTDMATKGQPIGNHLVPEVKLSQVKLIKNSSKKNSPLKEELKDKNKPMKTYNENDFSDSEETIIDSDSGEAISKKVTKEKTEGKNQIAIRIQNKFAELCRRNIGTTPILNIVTYKSALFALNSGRLTEKQIEDLFDEWFGLPNKKDEQLISISQALSKFNIDGYKVRNQIK
jgi:hypothetical protein